MSRSRSGKGNRGSVIVEFTLVILLLLLTLFGAIEFGWALYTKAVVTNAAREGARIATTQSATNTVVESIVQSYLSNSLLPNTATITINPPTIDPGPPITPGPGESVTVTVTYEYAPLIRMVRSSNWRIVASSSMRREGT